jgi:hypothetical protein
LQHNNAQPALTRRARRVGRRDLPTDDLDAVTDIRASRLPVFEPRFSARYVRPVLIRVQERHGCRGVREKRRVASEALRHQLTARKQVRVVANEGGEERDRGSRRATGSAIHAVPDRAIVDGLGAARRARRHRQGRRGRNSDPVVRRRGHDRPARLLDVVLEPDGTEGHERRGRLQQEWCGELLVRVVCACAVVRVERHIKISAHTARGLVRLLHEEQVNSGRPVRPRRIPHDVVGRLYEDSGRYKIAAAGTGAVTVLVTGADRHERQRSARAVLVRDERKGHVVGVDPETRRRYCGGERRPGARRSTRWRCS